MEHILTEYNLQKSPSDRESVGPTPMNVQNRFFNQINNNIIPPTPTPTNYINKNIPNKSDSELELGTLNKNVPP